MKCLRKNNRDFRDNNIKRIWEMDSNQIESWEETKVEDNELKSIEVYDTVKNCQYSVLVHQNSAGFEGSSDNEDIRFTETADFLQPTVWNQNETLALINIFSLHKDKFKLFKKKKHRWILVSNELKKIGIDKAPDRCDVKWRNLLRSYRAYKSVRKEHGKFEFFNELNAILTSDTQFKHIIESTLPEAHTDSGSSGMKYRVSSDEQNPKRKKCCCGKSEKQKRHEERMSLLRKKVDIEERKVKAFEEYLQFLKSTYRRD